MAVEAAAAERTKAAALLDEARAEIASLRETVEALQREVASSLDRAGAADVSRKVHLASVSCLCLFSVVFFFVRNIAFLSVHARCSLLLSTHRAHARLFLSVCVLNFHSALPIS